MRAARSSKLEEGEEGGTLLISIGVMFIKDILNIL